MALLSEYELRKEIDHILYGEHAQPFSTGDSLYNLFLNQFNEKLKAFSISDSKINRYELKIKVKALKDNGFSYSQIAKIMHSKKSTIQYLINPNSHKPKKLRS